MKDKRSSVMARHTGIQRQGIKGIRIPAGPSTIWPITPRTNNQLALARIRFRIIEAVTLSPVADIPSIGIGWASKFGQAANTIWQQDAIDLSAGTIYAGIFTEMIITSPPAVNDYLTFKIGDFVDVDQIGEAMIAAGFIRVEIGWHVFDEFGDLPDA